MTEKPYDLMILGTGPAGLTAAIYGSRLGLKVVVFGDTPGGNVYMINNLLNYPGFVSGIPGTQFGVITFQQAQGEGAFFPMARLEKLNCSKGLFSGIDVNGNEYAAKAALIATGREPVRLDVPNGDMNGIHFCSNCDGPLYRDKHATLAVIGNGNPAGQHALALSKIAKKVLLVCPDAKFMADAAHRKLIEQKDNISILLDMEVIEFKGRDSVETLVVSTAQGKEKDVAVDGAFMAFGWKPITDMLAIEVDKTEEGYLKTDENLMTSFPGLFAAGDVRDTDLFQVIASCADGARAATYAMKFLDGLS
jgi:thioredoxin reductase (NADPH)